MTVPAREPELFYRLFLTLYPRERWRREKRIILTLYSDGLKLLRHSSNFSHDRLAIFSGLASLYHPLLLCRKGQNFPHPRFGILVDCHPSSCGTIPAFPSNLATLNADVTDITLTVVSI